MSYDPSHRKPPRQERWPQATPPTGWPSYRDDDAYRDGEAVDNRYAADRQGAYQATAGYRRQTDYQGASGGPADHGYQSAVATDTFPPAMNGYGSAAGFGPGDGYGGAADDFAEAANGYSDTRNGYSDTKSGYAGTTSGYPTAADGYADAGDSFAGTADRYSRIESGYGPATDEYVSDADGYDWSENGYAGGAAGYAGGVDTFVGDPDGYAGARDDFADSAGYLGPGSYTEPGLSDPRLMAPDAGVDPDRWQADQDLRRETRRRGLGVGAVTGFLAAAVAIGVSTLAAGFVGRQASPMSALGSVFIDRMPAALKNVAVQHFGTHGRTVLLLGMYAAIAVLAVGIGVLARHAAAPGVAALAAFSLLAAFVTITRPGGHVSDVAPAIIGGIAGVVALLWLMQASAPTQRPQGASALRQTRGNSRRRA
jgi:hypothetical protein